MLNLLETTREIQIDGKVYASIEHAMKHFEECQEQIEIRLAPEGKVSSNNAEPLTQHSRSGGELFYQMEVKKWMTEGSTSGFDLLDDLSNESPAPELLLEGQILETTDKAYKVDVKGATTGIEWSGWIPKVGVREMKCI